MLIATNVKPDPVLKMNMDDFTEALEKVWSNYKEVDLKIQNNNELFAYTFSADILKEECE